MRINKTMSKILIVFFVLLGLALYVNWSNKSLVVTRYQYKSKQVPEQFDGFRVTQISDLQSELFGKHQKNLLNATAETKPDIIVFTGDLLDRNHTNYEVSLTAIRGLVKIAPVYYVNGNHELALPEQRMREFYEELRQMGVTILFDETAVLTRDGQQIYLLGISEYTLYESKEATNRTSTAYDPSVINDMIDHLTKDLAKKDLTVMLAHEPQFLDTYAHEKVDLIFAGHAHGGQIRLPFTEGLFAPGQGTMPKLTSGMHERDHTTMVISRGLGNSVFPFRFLNRPEIVVVDLKRG